jgi:hypothetical protein
MGPGAPFVLRRSGVRRHVFVDLNDNPTLRAQHMVSIADKVQVTSLEGQLKSSRAAPAELRFDFRIESVVCLPDSVLAFHRHGVQGRSFLNGSLTQDLHEESKTYEVLGSDKYVLCSIFSF